LRESHTVPIRNSRRLGLKPTSENYCVTVYADDPGTSIGLIRVEFEGVSVSGDLKEPYGIIALLEVNLVGDAWDLFYA